MKNAHPFGFAMAVMKPCVAKLLFDILLSYDSSLKDIFPFDSHSNTPKYIK